MTDATNDLQNLAAHSAKCSLKRARQLFDTGNAATTLIPSIDPAIDAAALQRRKLQRGARATTTTTAVEKNIGSSSQTALALVQDKPQVETVSTAGALARINDSNSNNDNKSSHASSATGILVKRPDHFNTTVPTPQWHAPWKLATVLSSHLGWVRSLAFDPSNRLFASGSADSTIRIWNLAQASVGSASALQLTLTGHISPVRGLAFSPRHPYLFSCGEDKMVKCFDLETNQVVRHYHGHLSGVFCLSLHPTLDLLVTGGRDAVARVWDMRTKQCVHVLAGHEHTVASLLTQSTHPQVITGSHDCTVKMWDLVAGTCFTTLTHHQKSVRALVQPAFEHTFVSGAPDCLKKWQGKNGKLIKTLTGHKSIINALAVNEDGVLVSGGDDGTLHFWDYATGYTFDTTQSQVQPGSLEAENAIFALAFDHTGTRLVTGEADKTIKIYKPDDEASELTHPIDMAAWRKKVIKEAKQRY